MVGEQGRSVRVRVPVAWGLSAGVAERLGSSAGLECLSLSAVSFSALPESRGEVPGSGDWDLTR